jgi:serine/threonine-protein kinase
MADRWTTIERLYHEAVARPAGDRSSFLAAASAGDEELRREVQALLDHDGGASFLSTPALAADTVPTLHVNQPLGPYIVTARLGAGGMGEVFRARDTRLGRDVAIKVLPAPFAADPDRLARFEREARLLASLNHPHIAAIYGLEQAEGVRALVLELVDGPTLADRLAKGALPMAEAISIAAQIADALEAAHEKGIVHRDLKPANVKLTPAGAVKVLDFGLAKVTGAGEDPSTTAPTLTIGGTNEGVILGTAAYMSPEQARGQAVDKRTDIWAFGCVLFQMLTGRAAFGGATVTDTLAAIVERQPDWQALPAAVSPLLRRLLGRCLEKDPRQRLRDIGDVRIELRDPTTIETLLAQPVVASWSRRAGRVVAAGLITAAAVGAGWALGRRSRPAAAAAAPARFAVELPAAAPELANSGMTRTLALSPDGTQLAFFARQPGHARQLWVRALDRLESRPIRYSEGGFDPFFSPDGRWLGFFMDQKIKKVSVDGGEPVTVCDIGASAPLGASWEPEDTIVFARSRSEGLWSVSAGGGTPRLLLNDKDTEYRWPHLLPDGKAVLFTSTTVSDGRSVEQIYVQSLATRERHALIEGRAAQFANGYLVFARGSGILAVPFDPVRLVVSDAPRPLIDRILAYMAGPLVTVSRVGSIAYVPPLASPDSVLEWVDRAGREQPLSAPPRGYQEVRLASDGHRVAAWIVPKWDQQEPGDVWIYDLFREGLTPLTSGDSNGFPVWKPDGTELAFFSRRLDAPGIYLRPTDGSGREMRLLAAPRINVPTLPLAWHPDGTLAYVQVNPGTKSDIMMLPRGDAAHPKPFVTSAATEGAPVFSPDGRFVAYVSDESGHFEVYVRPLAEAGETVQVSVDGGREPAWPLGGQELFYRKGDMIMAVDVMTRPTFAAGKPRRLFETKAAPATALWANFDVTPDAKRFLMIKPVEASQGRAGVIDVLLNWPEGLKRGAPAN